MSEGKKRLVRTCRKNRAFERISFGLAADATSLEHLKLLEKHGNKEIFISGVDAKMWLRPV